MLAQGRRDLAHDRAARPSGIAFGVLGVLLTIAGVVSVVTGMPSAAHGLGPLAGRLQAGYASRSRQNLTPCLLAPAHDAARYTGALG